MFYDKNSNELSYLGIKLNTDRIVITGRLFS